MKPAELRIGNWYMSVKFKTPVQCDLSDLYNLCANSDGAYNDPPIDDMFEPIPLTEDWLKKFGLEDNKGALDGFGGWLSPDINKPFTHRLRIRSDFTYFPNLSNFSFIEIKYVHQLQNLYFALTGKELNYEEKGRT